VKGAAAFDLLTLTQRDNLSVSLLVSGILTDFRLPRATFGCFQGHVKISVVETFCITSLARAGWVFN